MSISRQCGHKMVLPSDVVHGVHVVSKPSRVWCNKVKLIDRHTSVALSSFWRPSRAPALPCCSFAFIRTVFLLQ